MSNPFQAALEWVAKNFRKDASKMLIYTGVAGWALSSLAQIFGIVVNPKIKNDQKGFLVPQELADAAINISAFFLVTQVAKKTVSKLFSTGKFAPAKVREYFAKHPNISQGIGKVGFDVDEVLKHCKDKFPTDAYYNTKNFYTTMATVSAGILSSNIITPLIRNRMASKFQKNYLAAKNIIESENKIETPENKQPTFKANPMAYRNLYYSGNMRI